MDEQILVVSRSGHLAAAITLQILDLRSKGGLLCMIHPVVKLDVHATPGRPHGRVFRNSAIVPNSLRSVELS